MVPARDLIRSISGMDAGTRGPEEFAGASGLPHHAAVGAMKWWQERGIGSAAGNKYIYEDGSRLEAGIVLIKRGLPTGAISGQLGWRDFEGLAARILESEGFEVERNVVLKKPRSEIDVVGVRMGTAMLIDCKHWRRTVPYAVAERQVGRARQWAGLHKVPAVPVIVTLNQKRFDGGDVPAVPMVPISGLRSFVEDFFGNLAHVISVE